MTDQSPQITYDKLLSKNLKIRDEIITSLASEAKTDHKVKKLLLAYLSDSDNVALKYMKMTSDNENAVLDREAIMTTLKFMTSNNVDPFKGVTDTSNIPELQENIKSKYEIKESEKESFNGTTYSEFKKAMSERNPDLKIE